MPSPGDRVVLRYRLPSGSSHPMNDVLGILQSLDPVVVQAANGALTTVDRDRVVAIKAIPPRPVSKRAVRNLEHTAANAWPGLEQQWLGGWLLRAGAGFTQRANSVVPLGPPDTDDAVEQVQRWYADRGLTARFELPDRLIVDLPGWTRSSDIVVLTADVPRHQAVEVTVTDAPDEAWLAGYHYGGDPVPTAAAAVLSAVLDGELGFGRIEVDGAVAAIVRGAVTSAPEGIRWLGLTAVEVADHQRRKGLGTRICAGIAAWGHQHGAQRMYLQVDAANDAALALYRGMGFAEHHRYRYASPLSPR
jgi:GNAT superfamily N-acetyltransferase